MLTLKGEHGTYQLDDNVPKKGKFGGIITGRRVEDNLAISAKRIIYPITQQDHEKLNRIITINHPSLARTIEIVAADQSIFLIREFYEGSNLKTIFKKNSLHRHLSHHFFTKMAISLLEGLEQLHQMGLLHRDIKPANIIIRHSPGEHPRHWTPERAILIDFEQASVYPLTSASRSPFALVYSPPEQLLNHSELINASSDLFALSITLFEMLAGRPPYMDCNAEILLNLQLTYPLKNVKGVDPDLFNILAKASYKEPFPLPPKRLPQDRIIQILETGIVNRYHTAGDFKVNLERFILTHPEKPALPFWKKWLKKLTGFKK
jgi:serine/threonine protein kinase